MKGIYIDRICIYHPQPIIYILCVCNIITDKTETTTVSKSSMIGFVCVEMWIYGCLCAWQTQEGIKKETNKTKQTNKQNNCDELNSRRIIYAGHISTLCSLFVVFALDVAV